MSPLKYLIPLWTATAVYALLSVFFGTMGISAYNQLITERDREAANLETLRHINRKLEGNLDALRYDSDTLAVHARELGYGSAGERFVRIVGLGIPAPRIVPGHTISAVKPSGVSDYTIRIISLGSGFFLLVCMILYDCFRKRKRPFPDPRD
jgi:cell division protein FtsB